MTDTGRRQARHNPSRERDQPSDVQPLDTRKLAHIWRGLPEADRLPFLLALDEQIGNQMFELTMPRAADVAPDPWRADSADVGAWSARQFAKMAAQPAPPRRLRLDQLNDQQLHQVAQASTQEQVDQLLDQFVEEGMR